MALLLGLFFGGFFSSLLLVVPLSTASVSKRAVEIASFKV